MKKKNSGVIKHILKDHFDGYWTMYGHNFPDHKGEHLPKKMDKRTIDCFTLHRLLNRKNVG